jgi:hypothetical protein
MELRRALVGVSEVSRGAASVIGNLYRYAHMRAAYRTYSYALHGVRHYVTTYVYYSTADQYYRIFARSIARPYSPLAGLAVRRVAAAPRASPPAGASALCAACRPSGGPAPRPAAPAARLRARMAGGVVTVVLEWRIPCRRAS